MLLPTAAKKVPSIAVSKSFPSCSDEICNNSSLSRPARGDGEETSPSGETTDVVRTTAAISNENAGFSERNAYLNVRIPTGKRNALEEAPEADSIPSGEARQRSKPRQRIPGPEGRATDSAMLEQHAG
jgi:hypothetical protein